MDFAKEIVLENERVRLEPLQMHHLEVLLPYSEKEPELWTYSLVSGAGKSNLEIYMRLAIEGRAKGHSYPFAVFDKETQLFVGSTRFYDFQPHHRTTQLGYTWYGKNHHRTGINRHCKLLMLSYAFDTLSLERVEFRADALNARSLEAMKKIGCTVEGILRKNCQGPQVRRDSIILSILKEEWDQTIKIGLAAKTR